MSKKIIIKRYKNERQYQGDAQQMARKGYIVSAVASQQMRRSFFTVVMTGFLAILFPRKPQLIVTYMRA